MEDLDRDRAVQPLIVGLPDLGDATAAELTLEPVSLEEGPTGAQGRAGSRSPASRLTPGGRDLRRARSRTLACRLLHLPMEPDEPPPAGCRVRPPGLQRGCKVPVRACIDRSPRSTR